jgi:hypothetical protein
MGYDVTKRAFLLLLLAFVVPATFAQPETYQRSGPAIEEKFLKKGSWKGNLSFPKVYCATAPSPENVQSLYQAMYNGNAVYRAVIEYPEKLILAVAFSSIPAGRSAEADIAKLLAMNRETQARLKGTAAVFEVSELTTSFGPTIGLRMNNIESDTPRTGPFPLVRTVVLPPDGALVSMSVSRTFARGSERFEVAAMQLAPRQQASSTEEDMRVRLSSVVGALTESLQKCTGAMPLRVPK